MRKKTKGSSTEQATEVKEAEQTEQAEPAEVNMGVGWAYFNLPHANVAPNFFCKEFPGQ